MTQIYKCDICSYQLDIQEGNSELWAYTGPPWAAWRHVDGEDWCDGCYTRLCEVLVEEGQDDIKARSVARVKEERVIKGDNILPIGGKH
jgi:hypothetical protein